MTITGLPVFCFSSEIGVVTINGLDSNLKCSIYVDDFQEKNRLLTEYYTPINNSVQIYGLSEFFEMHIGNLNIRKFKILFDDDGSVTQMETTVIRCTLSIAETAMFFLQSHFLSIYKQKEVAPDSRVFVSVYSTKVEAVNVQIDYLSSSGVVLRQTKKMGDTTPNDITRFVIDGIYSILSGSVTIKCFTIICGQRTLSHVVDHRLLPRKSFVYTNCFGENDSISFVGPTKIDPSIEMNQSVINDFRKSYNVKLKPKTECSTGNLNSEQSANIIDFFISPAILELSGGFEKPIIITDIKCELTNSLYDLQSYKFTYMLSNTKKVYPLQ